MDYWGPEPQGWGSCLAPESCLETTSAAKPSPDSTRGWFKVRHRYVQIRVSGNQFLSQAAILLASLSPGYPKHQMSFLQYVVLQ